MAGISYRPTGRFRVRDARGVEYWAIETTEFLSVSGESIWIPGRKSYCLEDGTPLTAAGADRFLDATREVLTRIK